MPSYQKGGWRDPLHLPIFRPHRPFGQTTVLEAGWWMRGHEMGRAKNGTASNGDNPPAGDLGLAAGVLDRIEPIAIGATFFLDIGRTPCSTEMPFSYGRLKPVGD